MGLISNTCDFPSISRQNVAMANELRHSPRLLSRIRDLINYWLCYQQQETKKKWTNSLSRKRKPPSVPPASRQRFDIVKQGRGSNGNFNAPTTPTLKKIHTMHLFRMLQLTHFCLCTTKIGIWDPANWVHRWKRQWTWKTLPRRYGKRN